MRKALDSLPWVDKGSIQTDVPTREVRFNLKDKAAWNEEAVRGALNNNGFPEMTVKTPPH